MVEELVEYGGDAMAVVKVISLTHKVRCRWTLLLREHTITSHITKKTVELIFLHLLEVVDYCYKTNVQINPTFWKMLGTSCIALVFMDTPISCN